MRKESMRSEEGIEKSMRNNAQMKLGLNDWKTRTVRKEEMPRGMRGVRLERKAGRLE
jgi:hypothetical protein